MCKIFVETRGYYNAWVVLLDKNKNYISSAEAGYGSAFTPIVKRLKKGDWPEHLGKVLQQRRKYRKREVSDIS